jgi:hypothetical protein
MAGPGDEMAASAGSRGHLRASHADREQVISVLKAAFVQGLLDKDEFDLRVGQVLAARTCAELVAVTAGIPAGVPAAQPPRMPAQAQGWLTMKRAVTWSACMLIVTAVATVIGGVIAVRIDAGAALAVPFLSFFVATVVAGTMIGEAWDKKKRSRGQLPQGPAPDGGGQVFRGTGSAAEAEQLPPIDHGQQPWLLTLKRQVAHRRKYSNAGTQPLAWTTADTMR